MSRALLFIGLATFASAQQFWHLGGRVVDEKGRPIEGAFFDHTDQDESEYAERFTNREGIFDIWTHAPRIVLRKPGYASIIVRSEDTKKSEFKMRKAQSFATCDGVTPNKARPADAHLKFRPSSQLLLVTTRVKPTPNDNDVWRSIQYSERTYFIAGIEIIDARGIMKDGKRWRELIRVSESLSYRDADPATAKLLDEFLDRTCLDLHP